MVVKVSDVPKRLVKPKNNEKESLIFLLSEDEI